MTDGLGKGLSHCCIVHVSTVHCLFSHTADWAYASLGNCCQKLTLIIWQRAAALCKLTTLL